jgi:WD40 repeat protein
VWRITIRRRHTQGHRGLGAEQRGVMAFSKLLIFDVKVLGAVAVALVFLAAVSNTESVQRLAPSQIARGEIGGGVTSFAFSPTGKQMATTNSAGRVTLRAQERGWQIERVLDIPEYAETVAFSPDGGFLAVTFKGGVCLWDLMSPGSERTKTMVVPIQQSWRIAFSPDGQSLAVTTHLDGSIFLWDLATRRVRTVLHHPSAVTIIAYSPDGRWLAAGGRNHMALHIWDLHSGSQRILLDERHGPVNALAFSPDGSRLATANQNENYARLWDLETAREIRVFRGHARSINSIAFSPDGALLATAGNDGVVWLWTVATGQRRVCFDGKAICLRTVSFSPDGRTLVLAAGDDADIRLWDLAELLLLRAAAPLVDDLRAAFEKNARPLADLPGERYLASAALRAYQCCRYPRATREGA